MPVRALIVDDSSAVRAFVRAALEEQNSATVEEAATGFEALRCLAGAPYDLVIVDINMPDINGLELLSFMGKSTTQGDARRVVISTQISGVDADRAKALGAHELLAKPLTASALQELVADLGPGGDAA